MEGKREPFKNKDNNRILYKKDEKKKKSLLSSTISVTDKVTTAVINSISLSKKAAPDAADGQIPVIFISSGPSLADLWKESVNQSILELGMVVEQDYAMDIFSDMMKNQCKYVFHPSDIPKSVTSEMRTILMDWLVQVHEYLGLQDETLYLAVFLMNSYMKVHKIHISLLQLLAVSCLFIACKFEEGLIPKPAELCFMMEDAFSKKELLKMEKKILKRLSFKLHYTQPLYFLRILSTADKCAETVLYLAMYFMELTLLEADGAMVEPALLASGALKLAQMVSRESGSLCPGQTCQGSLYSYSDAELSSPQNLMAKAALRAGTESRATWRKYSRPQRLGVSKGPALANSRHLASCIALLSPCPTRDRPIPGT
ncbi:cyclin-P isoform X1 [Rana temporaria]|uniref:cyclin-P isoform X1 n=1 Tax=Rana temporaria TaxID=8407 RepID=UPI001AACE882|nr:cyclin-P isoform X1 [Rana temporaria]